MDEKYKFLQHLRSSYIDPVSYSDRYKEFLEFFDNIVRSGRADSYIIDHYLRYCLTILFADKISVDLDRAKICESGHGSVIATFLEQCGAEIVYTTSDLRYSMDVPGDMFDLVLSLEVIEHIKDQDSKDLSDIVLFNESGVRQYVSEIERVLKAGGRLILTTPNPNSLFSLTALVENRPPSIFRPHVREYTRGELVSLFDKFEVELYEANSCFSNFDLGTGIGLDIFEKNGWSTENRGDDHFLSFRKS